ncbi:hypothetical protein J4Q44_G00080160 [Coregonus suidteri]|uniref:Uncharacterized protein n=1 Tax=Coregonus suidteri TaxID=861788 RepID=A0AAN8MBX7_9TELE
MSKMQLLQDYLNERLTAVAVEIFGAVENTIAEYQEEISRSKEEIDRLRKLLDLVFQPDIMLHRADPQQLTFPVPEEVPPEQQHCEQEWSTSPGQEDPEPTQIKEEQEEFVTSQEEEQLQGLESDTKEFILISTCVKRDCDKGPPQSSHLPQTQTMENRERDSLPTKTIEQDIKTEHEEGYRESEPNNELQPLSPVNSDCSAAHIGNSESDNGVDSGGLMSGLQPHKSKRTWTKKGQSSKTREATATVEIFGAVENTIAEYQEEISRSKEEIERLRRLLDLAFKPDIKLHIADFQQLTLPVPEDVPPEQQDWSPCLGQGNPEPTQIKEEQEEFRTSHEEEQLEGLESDIKEFIFTLPCVKSDCDQDPPQPSHLPQTQTVENRERDSLPTKTTRNIKTEPDGEGYSVSEPTR